MSSMIEFSTTDYVFSHGHPPRGRGSWAFSFDRACKQILWAPGSMLYSDAKKWAVEQARKQHGPNCRGIIYVCT